ncbi:MAG: inorganic diphosphatase [Candidatus Altiarchaeota archaeon]|nr:inorganic diphosphatase [Candidatus Altiarchaeota archaeon]
MKVVVETPRYSFVKYQKGRREFISPLPNLFTYGYVKGTKADDGVEEDAVVLDGRHNPGEEVSVKKVGVVRVIDDGLKDDKTITSTTGNITALDRLKIGVFFTVYMGYKKLRHLILERRISDCRYLGFKH